MEAVHSPVTQPALGYINQIQWGYEKTDYLFITVEKWKMQMGRPGVSLPPNHTWNLFLIEPFLLKMEWIFLNFHLLKKSHYVEGKQMPFKYNI